MHKIFISYSRSSASDVAQDLDRQLSAEGCEVFLDTKMPPGAIWPTALKAAIDAADAMILLLSDGVENSDFVKWEVDHARGRMGQGAALSLIPIEVDFQGQLDPRLKARLGSIQTCSWGRQQGFDVLLDLIRSGLGIPEVDAVAETYRAWTLANPQPVRLIGLGPDTNLPLESIYVPLRVSRCERDGLHQLAGGAMSGRDVLGRGAEELQVDSLFREGVSASRHTLLLGEPGSGKTTALIKLYALCLEAAVENLGLAGGTLPVPVRLRHLSADDLGRPLGETLDRALGKRFTKPPLPSTLDRLWRAGRPLLLLLDGLDEITDDALRTEVCDYLACQLGEAAGSSVRAVVTCRRAYSRSVELGADFCTLEVRPLGPKEADDLVKLWFRAASHTMPDYSAQRALRRSQQLRRALQDSVNEGAQLRVIAGWPLMLTLLCVVMAKRGEIPRRRVEFYQRCVRLLLEEWGPLQERGHKAPITTDRALQALRPLAYELRSNPRGELRRLQVVRYIQQALPRGAALPSRVLEWLRCEAGVLDELAPHRFGFTHLALEEYLAAEHIAEQPDDQLLLDLVGRFDGERWYEVAQLLVALPGRGMFARLMEQLLDGPALLQQADLLRLCIEEADEVDVTPFLKRLADPNLDATRQAALLRLMSGQRDPRLLEQARALASGENVAVVALAERLMNLAEQATDGSTERCVYLVAHSADAEPAAEVAKALRRGGVRIYEVPPDELWLDHFDRICENCGGGVVVLVSGGEPPWRDPDVADFLEIFSNLEGRALTLARLPGAPSGWERLEDAWAERCGPVVDLTIACGPEQVIALVASLAGTGRRAPETSVGSSDSEFRARAVQRLLVEPVTGMRFLWVDGGELRMGTDEESWPGFEDEFFAAARPAHGVEVSGFWLAETPMTNRQYKFFMEADEFEGKPPGRWTDRRFSAEDQPVVGVSWSAARSCAAWLGRQLGQGRDADLPSEAQWEWAARGKDGRIYPWGDAEPTSELACFGLDWQEDRPASVGSYPAGRGPFGHLDVAGLVWEWCLDHFDGGTYSQRYGAPPERDPIVWGKIENTDEVRVLRGGGWPDPAPDLRSAIRFRFPARSRYSVIGFRVAVSPPSL